MQDNLLTVKRFTCKPYTTYLHKCGQAKGFALYFKPSETVTHQNTAAMSSRQRLKPVAPLKSALPDVFLRKNKFEERMLENKRKFLEKAEKKVMDRLAREQEEFAILNCVCIGNEADTSGSISETIGNCQDNFGNVDRSKEEYTSNYFNLSSVLETREKSLVSKKVANKNILQKYNLSNDIERNEQPENHSLRAYNCDVQPNPKGNHDFRRSKSDTSLTYMRNTSKSALEKIPEFQKVEKSCAGDLTNKEQPKTKEKRVLMKTTLTSKSSHRSGGGLNLKKYKEITGGVKTRAKSAPTKRTRATFSGRDGRAMSLTPVVKQFAQVSLNSARSRPHTAVRTLRDLPRTAQVQLKDSVYFLSQHKIEQQNEMTKIRTRRAMSAKTPKC